MGGNPELAAWIDWGSSAFFFYLAAVTVSRLIGLARRKRKLHAPYSRICIFQGCAGLCALETVRAIWDTFLPQHFPLPITLITVPFLLLYIGHAALDLYRQLPPK